MGLETVSLNPVKRNLLMRLLLSRIFFMSVNTFSCTYSAHVFDCNLMASYPAKDVNYAQQYVSCTPIVKIGFSSLRFQIVRNSLPLKGSQPIPFLIIKYYSDMHIGLSHCHRLISNGHIHDKLMVFSHSKMWPFILFCIMWTKFTSKIVCDL